MELHDNIAGCRSAENNVYKKTFEYHLRKIELLNLCSNQLYFAVEHLAKAKDIYEDHEIAVHALCTKIFRTLSACYKLLITGYYYDTLVLLRTCFESMLLMKYFSNKPQKIQNWFEGKEIKFGNMRDELGFSEFEDSWKYLSKFVHEKYEAICYNSYKKQIEGKTRFLTASEYDKELFLHTYQYMMLVFLFIFEILQSCFDEELSDDKIWKEDRIWLMKEIEKETY